MCNTNFLYTFDPRNSFLTLFVRLKVKVIINYNFQCHLSFIQFNRAIKRSLIPKITCTFYKVICDSTFLYMFYHRNSFLTVLLWLKINVIIEYSGQGHISFIQFYRSTERSLIPKIACNILSELSKSYVIALFYTSLIPGIHFWKNSCAWLEVKVIIWYVV